MSACFKYTCLLDAVQANDLDELKRMVDANVRLFHEGSSYSPAYLFVHAVIKHNLEMVKYLHTSGFIWDKWTPIYAAMHGQLECLQFAYLNGCPWNEYVCSSAARHGHLNCLQFAHENGFPWDKNTCSYAAADGNLECLRYAHSQGCPWDKYTCSNAAAENGHLDCLRYAHSHGCPWNEYTCYDAATSGKLECLRYAHSQGCELPIEKCSILAAENGHLNCFTYLFENAPNPQEFWDNSLDLTHIIDKIDLDDHVWRKLFHINLSKHPQLAQKVNDKRVDVSRRKEESIKWLYPDNLCKDVIQYCLYPFI